jgi:hypothetical protein
MANPVVNVQVSVQQAPAPSTLQKKGAFISQGATDTSPGTVTLLTQLSSLTPILKGALPLASLTYAGGTVTAIAAAPHGFAIGDTVPLTIAGCVPSGYNGTFNCVVTGASSFAYVLPSNPGANTAPGTYTEEDVNELVSQATTFFAQGGGQSVSVLELGPGNATDGVTFLTAWITQNPNTFYSYLVPRFWDGNSSFLAMLGNFNATNSKTYFFVTTTLATYGAYTSLQKCCFPLIEAPQYGVWAANQLTSLGFSAGSGAGNVTATTATNHGVTPGEYFQIAGCVPSGYNGTFLALPGTTGNTLIWALSANPGVETTLGTLVQSQYASSGIPSTEFSLAAIFWVTLNYKPSSTNKVTPLQFAFLFGVTPFPTQGNNSLITTLLAAAINIVGTGSQANISNTLVLGGTTKDGNPFKYWYSIDWVQINLQVAVTAALINGANNPQAPVDYNQPGINVLQQACLTTMSTGVGDGLVLNPIKPLTLNAADFAAAVEADTYSSFTLVNADPFASYTQENPNDYSTGTYNGLSVDYTPLRGFNSILILVNVSNFAS